MTNFRFAVMGAGNIANKFCDAVNRIADCEVAAVASNPWNGRRPSHVKTA